MKALRTPAFSIAAGLFATAATGLCAHLVVYWLLLSGRVWPRLHVRETILFLGGIVLAAQLLLAAGLSRLLRKAFRVWWAGAILWGLASVATGLWPLAALVPAALRLKNRRAALFAALAGGVFLLAGALLPAGCLHAAFWSIPVICAAATVLTLAALRALDDGARPHRSLAWMFALVFLASIATQPALHVGRVSREADAALAELLEAIDSPVDPHSMLPGPPPVPVAEDPVAALDADAIESDKRSFSTLGRMLAPPYGAPPRRHPWAQEELAAVAAWFATHTNLTAEADAMTDAPGYRSCLPGAESFVEAARGPFGSREPRAPEALTVAQVLYRRAHMALAAGDGDAGADAVRRLGNLLPIFEREPLLESFLMSVFIRDLALRLIERRIDLWNEEDLLALRRLAEDSPAWAERRVRIVLASSFLCGEGMFRIILEDTLRGGCLFLSEGNATSSGWRGMAAGYALLRGSSVPDYWIAAECRAYYRNALLTWKAARRILEMDEGPALDGEIRRLHEDDSQRGTALPPLAASYSAYLPDIMLDRLVASRDMASFIRAAVAVERFRRARGALPASLDALVPDFLAAVPLAARTGKPLLYEPGPIEVPEETFPVLRDPDEAAAESRGEGGDTRLATGGKPGPETRTLPAMTLPGFRLTLPDAYGRQNRDQTIDFFISGAPVSSPEP